MILGGPVITTQSSDMTEAQTSLSISQLMLFNATKRRRDSGTTGASYYYSRDREPPLPTYLDLVTLGDKLLQSGIVWDCRSRMIECWNYRLTWETVFAGALNQKESFVHLSFLKEFSQLLLWTILTTTRGAFHGTGISLFQHPTSYAPGEEREMVSIDNQPSKTNRLARLPDSYTAVRPVILPKNEPDVPPLQGPFVRICPGVKEAFS